MRRKSKAKEFKRFKKKLDKVFKTAAEIGNFVLDVYLDGQENRSKEQRLGTDTSIEKTNRSERRQENFACSRKDLNPNLDLVGISEDPSFSKELREKAAYEAICKSGDDREKELEWERQEEAKRQRKHETKTQIMGGVISLLPALIALIPTFVGGKTNGINSNDC